MTPRDPQKEVHDASLFVLEHAAVGFADEIISMIKSGQMLPNLILARLRRRYYGAIPLRNNYRAFITRGTVYDDRLLAEWQRFFEAMAERERIALEHATAQLARTK